VIELGQLVVEAWREGKGSKKDRKYRFTGFEPKAGVGGRAIMVKKCDSNT